MSDGVKLFMQVVVTLAFLVAGFYVVLTTGHSEELQKAAFGWLGVVLGYWLR
jgi:hypothetical protein